MRDLLPHISSGICKLAREENNPAPVTHLTLQSQGRLWDGASTGAAPGGPANTPHVSAACSGSSILQKRIRSALIFLITHQQLAGIALGCACHLLTGLCEKGLKLDVADGAIYPAHLWREDL